MSCSRHNTTRHNTMCSVEQDTVLDTILHIVLVSCSISMVSCSRHIVLCLVLLNYVSCCMVLFPIVSDYDVPFHTVFRRAMMLAFDVDNICWCIDRMSIVSYSSILSYLVISCFAVRWCSLCRIIRVDLLNIYQGIYFNIFLFFNIFFPWYIEYIKESYVSIYW